MKKKVQKLKEEKIYIFHVGQQMTRNIQHGPALISMQLTHKWQTSPSVHSNMQK